MDDLNALKKRLAHIFLKKGGEGNYTKLFENLLPFQREVIAQKSEIQISEAPIVGGYKDDKEWILLTTKKLVWQCGTSSFVLPLSEIINADVDFDKMIANRLTMNDVREIEIEADSFNKIVLKMEAGYPLSGMWNILLHLSWRNNQQKKN